MRPQRQSYKETKANLVFLRLNFLNNNIDFNFFLAFYLTQELIDSLKCFKNALNVSSNVIKFNDNLNKKINGNTVEAA